VHQFVAMFPLLLIFTHSDSGHYGEFHSVTRSWSFPPRLNMG